MSDELTERVRSDFSRARFKAFLNRISAVVSGRPTRLLSYDDVKSALHIGGPIYRGVRTVRVEDIVGSLNRYHQFDRAVYLEISLPPVWRYKVGEGDFGVDGHHRVAVAREQGQEFIEAEVRECSTKVNITPDLKPEDLVILGEKVDF